MRIISLPSLVVAALLLMGLIGFAASAQGGVPLWTKQAPLAKATTTTGAPTVLGRIRTATFMLREPSPRPPRAAPFGNGWSARAPMPAVPGAQLTLISSHLLTAAWPRRSPRIPTAIFTSLGMATTRKDKPIGSCARASAAPAFGRRSNISNTLRVNLASLVASRSTLRGTYSSAVMATAAMATSTGWLESTDLAEIGATTIIKPHSSRSDLNIDGLGDDR